uniref:Large ribosomal subunit protein uL23c n=1 Tax=Chloropicon maureeniae TaxID=1461542 RepID=A0A4D6C4X1_9CHLO|nr:ribosomal protein L23 [Chloropicon maureeniae]QBX98208.1 ribosomal protein L23 [Chloropicon maureeniae]
MIRPVLTEKSLRLMEEGQYTFDIKRQWTKPQIKFFIEDLFKVEVQSIRTYRLPSQLKTQKRTVVKLKENQSLDYTFSESE